MQSLKGDEQRCCKARAAEGAAGKPLPGDAGTFVFEKQFWTEFWSFPMVSFFFLISFPFAVILFLCISDVSTLAVLLPFVLTPL